MEQLNASINTPTSTPATGLSDNAVIGIVVGFGMVAFMFILFIVAIASDSGGHGGRGGGVYFDI